MLRRLARLLHWRRADADLAEELEHHRAMVERDLEARGVARAESAAEVRRRVGSTLLAREQSRDVWVAVWLQDVWQDVRFALRILVRDRRFTAAAVIALALGIGVTHSMFGVVNMMLIRKLPFERADRLVGLRLFDRDGRIVPPSYADLVEWRDAMSTLSGIAACTDYAPMNLSEEGRSPERLLGTYISSNAFGLLRTKPIAGRDFVADDDRPGAAPVAILSYSVWEQRYELDPTIVGRTVRINSVPTVIVGIMPPKFKFPVITQIWQPMGQSAAASRQRDTRGLRMVFGRLSDDVDLAGVQAHFVTVTRQLEQAHPDSSRNLRGGVLPLRDAIINTAGIVPVLMTFMGAVTLVLLIACANVANLLLARATTRAREIAIRASLGATRWRIVRQMLIECLVMSALASALGFVLSLYGAREIAHAADPIQPGADAGSLSPFFVDVRPDLTMFAFAGLVCVIVTFLFGLVPSAHVARANIRSRMTESGPGTVRARRLTSGFIVAEIALTLMLLTSAGLLWRSFYDAYLMDPGIDTSDVVTARLALPPEKYTTADQRRRFLAALDARVSQMASVSGFTIASSVPLSPASPISPRTLDIDGRVAADDRKPVVSYIYAGSRYFDILRLPIVRGRSLRDSDGLTGQEAAVVDERFVTTYFPNDDAIGHRIRLTTGARTAADGPWLTIVGVARTIPTFQPPAQGRAVVYTQLGADPSAGPTVSLLVRSAAPVGALVPAIREQVRALDRDLPLFEVYTLEEAVAASRFGVRLVGTWFAVIAAIALVLATVGVYALTAHGVAERTREVGVRLALGAPRRQVLWLFLRRLTIQIGIGVGLGLTGALLTGQLLRIYLGTTNPRDPLVLFIVIAILTTIAIVACLVPARRAARLDPVAALRHE